MDTTSIRQHYDHLSQLYDRQRHRAFFYQASKWLLSELGPKPLRVLEVGCGTGGFLEVLLRAGHEAYGVDLSSAMCQLAATRLSRLKPSFSARVRKADFQETPGFSGPFDALLLLDSWEFFQNPRQVAENASKVLVASGAVLLMTPNPLARPLIEFLERTGIKPLRPAFCFGQSSEGSVRKLFSPSFRVVKKGTLFWGLERWYRLERSEPS